MTITLANNDRDILAAKGQFRTFRSLKNIKHHFSVNYRKKFFKKFFFMFTQPDNPLCFQMEKELTHFKNYWTHKMCHENCNRDI